jgi:sulfite oxidase
MNGEDIPLSHGYPVRLVCPGMIGVRSCKWVTKLIISDEEADHVVQRRDYKIVKETDMAKVDWTKYDPIFYSVINSAIASPSDGQVIEVAEGQKFVEINGWAHGSGKTGA